MAQQTVVVDVALLGKMTGYIEMLVKDPHSTVFAALSDIYRTFGLHDEAVAVAKKGSTMLPDYVPGLISLGRALAENGDPSAASIAYRQALVLDPANIAALTGLASTCLGCGQSKEALDLLTQAQQLDPHDDVVKQLFPIVQKLLATSALLPPAEDPISRQPVISPSEEVLAVVDESPEPIAEIGSPLIATATLADIYIKQGFLEKALRVFSDLLAAEPDNSAIQQRYDALSRQINSPENESLPVGTEPVSRNESESVAPPTMMSELSGKDALIALYGRWIDAVQRRRADVH